MDAGELNRRFALFDGLRFVEGAGGLVLAEIRTPQAQALVSTYAGQVLSYVPHGGHEDLLFVSRQAWFEPGKAIKGGIPLCWPWFGPHPQGGDRPAHGFVRTRQWQVLSSAYGEDDAVVLRMVLEDSTETRELWPHPFVVQIEIEVGARLEVALSVMNRDSTAVELTQGLHTYFRVGDAAAVEVQGLDGRTYLDKLEGSAARRQAGPVTVAGEVDRIYLDTPPGLTIHDPVLGRRIDIDSSGSRSTVIWNPWRETAARMADLGDDEYRRMLCVETTNAADDKVLLEPGAIHRLAAGYRLEKG